MTERAEPWMARLDQGPHEDGCLRFPTGWLCTVTCPVDLATSSEQPSP